MNNNGDSDNCKSWWKWTGPTGPTATIGPLATTGTTSCSWRQWRWWWRQRRWLLHTDFWYISECFVVKATAGLGYSV